MNLKSAMNAFGMFFGRVFPTNAASQPAREQSSHATPHYRAGALLMVYRCNKSSQPCTCQCGVRFTPDTGVWPHAVATGEPLCMSCDQASYDITTDDRLARAVAEAERLFNVPQSVSTQVVTALRARRGL